MVMSGGERVTPLSPASGPDAVRAADSLLKAAGAKPGDLRSLGGMQVVEDGKSCFVTGPITDGYTGKTVATPRLPISCESARQLLSVQEAHRARVAALAEHRRKVKEGEVKIPCEQMPAVISDVRAQLAATGRYTTKGLAEVFDGLLRDLKAEKISPDDYCLNGVFRIMEERLAFGPGGGDSFNMGIPGETELEGFGGGGKAKKDDGFDF